MYEIKLTTQCIYIDLQNGSRGVGIVRNSKNFVEWHFQSRTLSAEGFDRTSKYFVQTNTKNKLNCHLLTNMRFSKHNNSYQLIATLNIKRKHEMVSNSTVLLFHYTKFNNHVCSEALSLLLENSPYLLFGRISHLCQLSLLQ